MRTTSVWRILLVALAAGLCLFSTSAKAWENEDYEIFELQSALEASEGKGATFYSLLNLTKTATSQQIKTAYRRRSVELHPDKHPSDPKAAKRFERLGLVNKILRSGRKDRYDHFLSTGFPKWRGTGYYYQRFRPGIGAVLIGLVVLSSVVELLVKRINYTRDKKRIEDLKKGALLAAWGPRFFQAIVPGAPPLAKLPPSEKKVKVPINAGATLPSTPSKEDVEGNKVDWDQLEKTVRSAAAATTACCGSSAPQRSIDVLVSREEDGEAVVWVTDEESGEWVELNAESALQGPPRLMHTWPVRTVNRALAAAKGSDKGRIDASGTMAAGDDGASASALAGHAANGETSAVKRAGNGKSKKGRK
ncbi:unnamed protein product [Parajaminaea phylloscopi]